MQYIGNQLFINMFDWLPTMKLNHFKAINSKTYKNPMIARQYECGGSTNKHVVCIIRQ